jgi:hypothetical protein
MYNIRINNNFSSIYLFLILVTIGIRFPINNVFSSLSVFTILLAFFHHLVIYFIANKKFNKNLIKYNILFSLIILIYTFIAFLNKKLSYPTYPLIILFFQWTFFLIISNLNYDLIKRTFTSFIILNFVFYLIQITGALIGSENLLKLEFILAEKSGIEFVSIFPRASGLITEPSHLSYVILPVIIISIYNFKNFFLKPGIKKFVLFFYFFTFSIISYFQLIFAYIIYSVKKINFINLIRFSLVTVVLILLLSNFDVFFNRINGINNVVAGGETKESSVLSLQSNLLVMIESIKSHPFFGGGLTSHRTTYEQFIGSLFPEFTEGGLLGLNQNDAGSMYILILSEFGLIGFVCYIIFSIKCLFRFYKNLELNIVPYAYTLTLFLLGFRYGNIASFYILFYLQVTFMGLAHDNNLKYKKCTIPAQL